jgi:hypothetical protein
MDLSLWWGVMVPIATPKPIVDKINGWFAQIVGSDETKKFLADAGGRPDDQYARARDRDVPDRHPGMGRIRPDREDSAPIGLEAISIGANLGRRATIRPYIALW